MKTILLFCIGFLTLNKATSQVVFCPPGAEWHYYFAMTSTQYENEHIKYERDTVIGQNVVKLISHTRFYYNCSTPQLKQYTQIRQSGDTLFFKNYSTQNTWQILYNFACQPGQTWQTTFKAANGMSVITSTYTVYSVSTVTLNGMSLKKLTLDNNNVVTERLGSDKFLFMLNNPSNPTGCNTGLFAGNLCYSDSSFGLKQYSSLPCYYDGVTGIDDLNYQAFKVYPNPVSDFIYVEDLHSELRDEDYFFVLRDISGRSMMTDIPASGGRMNVSTLEKGVYFLNIFKNNRLIATQKVLKD